MKSKLNFNIWTVITLCIFLLVAIFLIYPLLILFISGFRAPRTGEFTLANFALFFSRRFYYSAFFNSIRVTTAVTTICLALGVPMAYLMATCKVRGKQFLEILIIISMMSPPFIGAYSWILMLGRNGFITNLLSNAFGIQIGSIYGFFGIALVFSLRLYPLIYLFTSGALGRLDISLLEASENLGCRPLKRLFSLTVPLILPSVMAGALLVFTNAFSDFGTPMMIGEGFRVMPVLVFAEFVGEVGGSAHFASALSMMMVLVTIVIFLLQRYIVNKKSYEMTSTRYIEPVEMNPLKSFFVHLFIYTVVFLATLPMITIIISSFRNTSGPIFVEGWSLENYRNALARTGFTVVNTYTFAIISIFIVFVLAMAIAYVSVRQKNMFTNLLDTVTMLPLIISGTVMGITLLQAFNSRPILLSGTSTILIIAFVIRRMPFTIRSSSAILRQLSVNVEEASISLGYTPLQTFLRITAPMMMSGVISGLILSWVSIINELSASIILYTGRTTTMSVAIYIEVFRNNFGIASALSTILTLTIIISLVIFFKVTGKKSISL